MHYKCSDNDDIPQQFHVVVSIFCLEYSSENLEGYRHAVRNAVNLIEPNGFLVSSSHSQIILKYLYQQGELLVGDDG